MSRRTLVFTVAVVTLLAAGACRGRPGSDAAAAPLRTVAFDNLYGDVAEVPVYVTVDGGLEQALTATCDPKACTFKLPLTNARHDMMIAVVQNGRRSTPARVTLDTSNLR